MSMLTTTLGEMDDSEALIAHLAFLKYIELAKQELEKPDASPSYRRQIEICERLIERMAENSKPI